MRGGMIREWFRTPLEEAIEDWLETDEPTSSIVDEIIDLVVETYGPPF